jgi:hypothetical protein
VEIFTAYAVESSPRAPTDVMRAAARRGVVYDIIFNVKEE